MKHLHVSQHACFQALRIAHIYTACLSDAFLAALRPMRLMSIVLALI